MTQLMTGKDFLYYYKILTVTKISTKICILAVLFSHLNPTKYYIVYFKLEGVCNNT